MLKLNEQTGCAVEIFLGVNVSEMDRAQLIGVINFLAEEREFNSKQHRSDLDLMAGPRPTLWNSLRGLFS